MASKPEMVPSTVVTAPVPAALAALRPESEAAATTAKLKVEAETTAKPYILNLLLNFDTRVDWLFEQSQDIIDPEFQVALIITVAEEVIADANIIISAVDILNKLRLQAIIE